MGTTVLHDLVNVECVDLRSSKGLELNTWTKGIQKDLGIVGEGCGLQHARIPVAAGCNENHDKRRSDEANDSSSHNDLPPTLNSIWVCEDRTDKRFFSLKLPPTHYFVRVTNKVSNTPHICQVRKNRGDPTA